MLDLNEVVGQKHAKAFLQGRLDKDNVPQVIILHGSPGLGKTSIARIIAVNINANARPDLKEQLTKEVIVDKNPNVGCVKTFNMSTLGDDAIQSVVSELNVGLSSTGRKVLILDEAHGMTDRQQDAILTLIDPPPENVYVILCTTDIGNLSSSLLSRSSSTIHLKPLSSSEILELARKIITEKNLSFDIGMDRFLHYLTIYTERQARNVVNFLANFEPNTVVSQSMLEVFIDTHATKKCIVLIKYLYNSMLGGIDFLSGFVFDNNACEALIEVCNVVMGENSTILSYQEISEIRNFFLDKNPRRVIKFTAEVCGLRTLEKRRVVSAFMRNSADYDKMDKPVSHEAHSSVVTEIAKLVEVEGTVAPSSGISVNDVPVADSLESLFSKSRVLD